MGWAIEACALGQRTRSGETILRDVSLTVGSGELVAIIGPSGSGKTTLLDVLSGLRAPATGTVTRISRNIGYVPQDDIIHHALPLERTLRYAASLREVSPEAVGGVLRTLELTDRSRTAVGDLSGGQRKRACIAAELLAAPALFFLDEPTSGLDPARGTELMRTLRALTGDGTTVVLTTHNPLDAARCDKIAVLAPGGLLAFSGAPAGALDHFGVGALDEIYEKLPNAKPFQPFQPRFPRTDRPVSPAPTPPDHSPSEAKAPAPRSRLLRPLRQWSLLTRRNADLLVRDKVTLGIVAGVPGLVLGMLLILFRPGAFDPAHPSPEATVMMLFWLAVGAYFFGLSYGLLQICTEFGVLFRERFTGVGVVPYLLAKVAVLLPLLAVVDGVFLVALRALGRLPESADYGLVCVTMLLSSVSALGLGLLISAAVTDPSQVALLMPIPTFPVVMFSGGILPVPVMATAAQWISYVVTGRWMFEALGNGLGVARLWASGRSPLGPPLLASYGSTFSRPVAEDWLILGVFTAVYLATATAVVLRKTRSLSRA